MRQKACNIPVTGSGAATGSHRKRVCYQNNHERSSRGFGKPHTKRVSLHGLTVCRASVVLPEILAPPARLPSFDGGRWRYGRRSTRTRSIFLLGKFRFDARTRFFGMTGEATNRTTVHIGLKGVRCMVPSDSLERIGKALLYSSSRELDFAIQPRARVAPHLGKSPPVDGVRLRYVLLVSVYEYEYSTWRARVVLPTAVKSDLLNSRTIGSLHVPIQSKINVGG